MAVALAGLIALLWPLWVIQTAISRLRTARHTSTPVEIPRVDIADTDLQTVMRHRTPVIITGLTASLDLDLLPDLDGLHRLADDGLATVPRQDAPRSLAVLPLPRRLRRRTRPHQRRWNSTSSSGSCSTPSRSPGTCTYRLFSVADLDGRVGDIVDDISDRLAERTDATPDRQASGLWIGSRWCRDAAPSRCVDRSALPVPRRQADPHVLTGRSGQPVLQLATRTDGRVEPTARVDRPTPISTSSPASPTQRRTRVSSRPARCSFIPPYWSHEIEALEANISMPFRFTTSVREYLDPGFLMPAMEIFDSKFMQPRTPQR